MTKTVARIAVWVLAACGLAACASAVKPATGKSEPDLGWLFLDRGPYTLETKVAAAPGPGLLEVVADIHLMEDNPEILLSKEVTVSADSMLRVQLGNLKPGFYQLRLRNEELRWNIGVRPDEVVSPPDAAPDFDAFWESTLTELAGIPLDAQWTPVPEYSNEQRSCFEVRYPSFGGALSGGIISLPNAPGKYPVIIDYMGYNAPTFYFDPSERPECIEYLVSIREQGLFRTPEARWIDEGLASKEGYYYRGAFADARRAVDFVASLDKADTTRIVARGESQGGALTFVAAALDSRIKAIAPAVPFLGDYRDYGRIVWWPVHEVLEQADSDGIPYEQLYQMLTYFDVKNFAPRITCPVYMAFGLQDPTCPPHTNFAIYNNLGSTNKRYFCVPTCGHAMWMETSWSAERDAFLAPWLE